MADLASAAHELEAAHGLASVEGGSHPEWGTANRIVPLGGAYLELIAVVDGSAAELSPFGRWIAASSSATARPLGWAVRIASTTWRRVSDWRSAQVRESARAAARSRGG